MTSMKIHWYIFLLTATGNRWDISNVTCRLLHLQYSKINPSKKKKTEVHYTASEVTWKASFRMLWLPLTYYVKLSCSYRKLLAIANLINVLAELQPSANEFLQFLSITLQMILRQGTVGTLIGTKKKNPEEHLCVQTTVFLPCTNVRAVRQLKRTHRLKETNCWPKHHF